MPDKPKGATAIKGLAEQLKTGKPKAAAKPSPKQAPPRGTASIPEDHDLALAEAETRVAETDIEAARARAEVARAKSASLRQQAESNREAAAATTAQATAASAQSVAAETQREAAKAQADAALAQMDAAKVQAEAAIAQAEAARETLELTKQELTLLEGQASVTEDRLAVATRQAKSTSFQAMMTAFSAVGVLGVGAVAALAVTGVLAPPAPVVPPPTEAEALSAMQTAVLEDLSAEMAKLRSASSEERTTLGARLDQATEKMSLLSLRLASAAGGSTKRIALNAPGEDDGPAWFAAAKSTPAEGQIANRYSVEGKIRLPAKGAFVTVDAYDGTSWWPVSGQLEIARLGDFAGDVRLPQEAPEKIRFVLNEGERISHREVVLTAEAP